MPLHARKQLSPNSQQPRSSQARALAVIAVERLMKLAVAGVPAQRMVAAACGIVAGWHAEAMQPNTITQQLEALRTDIDGGVSAAEDYVADADETDKPKALVQLAALRATQQALKAEAERLS